VSKILRTLAVHIAGAHLRRVLSQDPRAPKSRGVEPGRVTTLVTHAAEFSRTASASRAGSPPTDRSPGIEKASQGGPADLLLRGAEQYSATDRADARIVSGEP